MKEKAACIVLAAAIVAGAGAEVLAGAGAAVAQDSETGKTSFAKCQACHAVGPGAKNKLGPEPKGLAVRKAGAAVGYQYSPALKNAGFTWDQSSFADFMQNPRTKVPGNKIAFAGMKDKTEIAGLWIYLQGPTRSEGVVDFFAKLAQEAGTSEAEVEKEFIAKHRPTSLIRRLATVEEVANMVVFVCSTQASATTGAALRVDGGVVQSIG